MCEMLLLIPIGILLCRGRSRAGEAVKKSGNEQKHLAQRRKGAETKQKIKELCIVNLCASASLREVVYFFTPSDARATSTSRV